MKKQVKIQLALVTALALIASTTLAAAETPPATPSPGGTLEQRVAQRKAERGTALNENDSKRLIGACVGAQIKLRGLQKNDVAMLIKRTRVYNSIDAKQWIVIGQLKLASQDTFPLQKQHQATVDKINKFQSIAADYKQALDDAIVINCQADPNGFKALLDTTRLYFDQLRAQSSDIHNHVVNTVKPTLKTHAADLQAKAATGQETP